MPPEAEELNQETAAPIAGSDEVTDAEYAAWEKGENPEPEVEEEAQSEAVGGEEAVLEEPASEEEAEPAVAAQEEEDDGTLSRGLKKRLDKIREREAAALQREAAANARAAAAEALLAVQRVGNEEPTAETGTSKERVYTQAELSAEATKLATQQVATDNFNRRCDEVADVGQKEFGAKWAASLEALKDVGAISDDPSFLQDALDTESPAKVLHHLGQNPDEAERLLALSPSRRAVALDRLSVQLTTVQPKTPKAISKAAAPIAPVGSGRSAKEIDINDPNLSDDEAFAAFERLDRQRAMG